MNTNYWFNENAGLAAQRRAAEPIRRPHRRTDHHSRPVRRQRQGVLLLQPRTAETAEQRLTDTDHRCIRARSMGSSATRSRSTVSSCTQRSQRADAAGRRVQRPDPTVRQVLTNIQAAVQKTGALSVQYAIPMTLRYDWLQPGDAGRASAGHSPRLQHRDEAPAVVHVQQALPGSQSRSVQRSRSAIPGRAQLQPHGGAAAVAVDHAAFDAVVGRWSTNSGSASRSVRRIFFGKQPAPAARAASPTRTARAHAWASARPTGTRRNTLSGRSAWQVLVRRDAELAEGQALDHGRRRHLPRPRLE